MVLLSGTILWTINVERNDLTFNNTRWDVRKTQQLIWQNILEYSRIAWETTYRDVDKDAIYDNLIGKYNEI